MSSFQALNFKRWIDENRHLLKPPVGNKVVFKDHEFIVMVVGGPNERTDFHVNQGEEFFYQIEGDMTLRIYHDGHINDVRIKAGDIYLLPRNVPHSPQREAQSIGLVIERARHEGENDGLQWYCENCEVKLYEEFFKLTDIEKQFPIIFDKYYSSPNVKCSKCNHVNGRKWTNWKHAEN